MGHTETPQLRRSLGFWSLLAYGVGDMLGAGIYALVGRVAGIAGSLAWFSFAIAMLAATLTACVYAELATRFPKSGGAAHYCDQVFRRPSLSIVIGWLVLCSGLVSMATSSRAFAGYLYELSGGIPHIVAICGFLFIVGTVTYRGIRESSAMNILCTTIELSGLLLVLSSGLILLFGGSAPESPTPAPSPESAMGSITALLILQGAGLAFFACIGFEDIANVTEEVKSPERTVPRALLSAMAVVSL
ncbi:MAG TPA: amino acid permease, partial [Candidatus Hydrogenedentes bacterium]|nr:amino acid permease [Candidatus Hydrogenedentota bacterium]